MFSLVYFQVINSEALSFKRKFKVKSLNRKLCDL